jgi:DNA-binding transcriptional LysR family regulator
MQLESLEAFLAVARYGSISGAAQSLGFTQSAVSRQVATLEAQTDTRLFDRLPRGVALTEEGRCLLPHAEAVVDRMATARGDLAALRGLGGGRLRLGSFPTALAALVPRALAAFRRDHPEVALSLTEGRTPALLEHLRAGDTDVAVVSAPPGQPIDASRFDLHHLLDEHLLVAVAAEHPLAGRGTARLTDFAADPFIVGSATAEDTLMRVVLPPGFRPRVDIVTADWTAKLGCVAAGLGVALIPALAVRAAPADIWLVPLHTDDAPARQVFAATAANRGPSLAAGAIIACLRRASPAADSIRPVH